MFIKISYFKLCKPDIDKCMRVFTETQSKHNKVLKRLGLCNMQKPNKYIIK